MSEPLQHRSGATKPKLRPRRRAGIRIDMTPMVDVAFLLLTFFMVTSAFRRPQTIEITIPADKENSKTVQVSESNIFQIWIHRDGRYAYKIARQNPNFTTPPQIFSLMHSAIRQNIQSTPGTAPKDRYKLILVFKIHPHSAYENMVFALDELNRAIDSLNIELKLSGTGEKLMPRFTFVTMTPDDTLFFK